MVDKTIRKVQALLDKASSTEFAAEREALLAKADALMAKHSIDQFQLQQARAKKNGRSVEITHVELSATGDQARAIIEMMYNIGSIIGTRGIVVSDGRSFTKPGVWTVRLYGFSTDLEYLERLHASLQISILRHISPKVDPALGYDENVYRLHEAGIKWREIAAEMNLHRDDTATGEELWAETPWPDGGRLIRAYRRHCKLIGEEPHAVLSSKGYRDSFMLAFKAAVSHRIRESRKNFADEVKGTGAELVLVDKSKKVDEAISKDFPKMGSLRRSNRGRMDSEGFARGEAAGRIADIGSGRIGGGSKALA